MHGMRIQCTDRAAGLYHKKKWLKSDLIDVNP